MAITGPIPLPESGMDAFLTSLQMGQENKLRAAQAQQAQGNAEYSKMLTNLFNTAYGAPEGGMAQGAGAQNAGMPNAGSSQQQAKNRLEELGLIHRTEKEKEDLKRQSNLAEKTLEKTAEFAMGGLPVNASFSALDQLFKNPSYQNVSGTGESTLINAQPGGIPVGSVLQKLFPKKFPAEDAKLLSMAQSHFGNITTGVATKFKGPFKAMVNNIIGTMKPNSNDSLPVQQAKVQAWKQLSDLGDKQVDLIAQYINQGMDPTAAILKVSKELMPEFQQIVSQSANPQQVQGEQPRQPRQQEQAEQADQPTQIEKSGAGAKILRKGLELPKFNSPEEFKAWFRRQPDVTKEAIRMYYSGKGS